MGPQQGGGSAVAPNWACLPHLPRWPLLHCPGQAVAGTPIHQGLSKAEEGEAWIRQGRGKPDTTPRVGGAAVTVRGAALLVGAEEGGSCSWN